MIRFPSILIFNVAALLFSAKGQAPENPLLETLTALNRLREVCEGGGPRFQLDKDNCGRFYECGIVGLAYHYVSALVAHKRSTYSIIYLQECPSDYLFNVEQQYCDHPERIDCGERPRCEKETGSNCVNGRKLNTIRILQVLTKGHVFNLIIDRCCLC